MKLSLDSASSNNFIRGYSRGEIRIDERVFTRSILLGPGFLQDNWRPQTLDDLRQDDMKQIAVMQPELVVLGVGERQRFPSASVLAPLLQLQIGVEVMTTDAACRTYNVLLAEGRKVIAALLMLQS